MTENTHATFTLRNAQETLGLSRTVLAGLISAGFVAPSRGTRNEHRFTFQDLMLLRTAYTLQQSGIPPRKILKSLAKLKASLPAELPLTGLRITAIGADVAVRDRSGTLAAATGQLLMDFEVAASGSRVTFLERGSAPQDPRALLRQARTLEAAGDLGGAEMAYRRSIEADPGVADGYLDLGAMLSDHGRGEEAVNLYEAAIANCPDSALVWFNRAIALEDRNQFADAMASYERSLVCDPALADAHFNLGRLREKAGDPRAALRHFNAYRRLQR